MPTQHCPFSPKPCACPSAQAPFFLEVSFLCLLHSVHGVMLPGLIPACEGQDLGQGSLISGLRFISEGSDSAHPACVLHAPATAAHTPCSVRCQEQSPRICRCRIAAVGGGFCYQCHTFAQLVPLLASSSSPPPAM